MKRGKKMIILLGILAAMLGGYVCIGQLDTSTQISESEGEFPLWEEGAAVASLRWKHGEEEIAFEMGESVFIKEGDERFPVNQTVLQNLADTISGLKAERELTDVSSFADYGLDEPAFTVTAANAQGELFTFAQGDATPFADGYYLSVTGRDAVYVIADDLSSAFDKELTQLAVMEDMPQAVNVTRMTAGSTLDICYDVQTGAYTDTASGELLDEQAAADLIKDAKELAWSALISTAATQEELAAWGLDDAQATVLTLYDGETQTLRLLLGGTDSAGDRYARLPDSDMVYTLSASQTDGIFEAGVDTLWNRVPVTMTVQELGVASFAWNGGERTLTAQDAESETAVSIMEQLCAIQGTQRVELGAAGEEILSVKLEKAEGESQMLTFYACDVDSYLLPVTKTHGMLVPAQDVDRLLRLLRQQG